MENFQKNNFQTEDYNFLKTTIAQTRVDQL
jgi:hypothetical protein